MTYYNLLIDYNEYKDHRQETMIDNTMGLSSYYCQIRFLYSNATLHHVSGLKIVVGYLRIYQRLINIAFEINY